MSFPPPAESQVNESLDLNTLCVQHPAATFFMRLENDIRDHQLRTGDMLVVDRSVRPNAHAVVVGVIDGNFFVREFSSIAHTPNSELWGTVVSVIRTHV
jgi:DNA polymerase V